MRKEEYLLSLEKAFGDIADAAKRHNNLENRVIQTFKEVVESGNSKNATLEQLEFLLDNSALLADAYLLNNTQQHIQSKVEALKVGTATRKRLL